MNTRILLRISLGTRSRRFKCWLALAAAAAAVSCQAPTDLAAAQDLSAASHAPCQGVDCGPCARKVATAAISAVAARSSGEKVCLPNPLHVLLVLTPATLTGNLLDLDAEILSELASRISPLADRELMTRHLDRLRSFEPPQGSWVLATIPRTSPMHSQRIEDIAGTLLASGYPAPEISEDRKRAFWLLVTSGVQSSTTHLVSLRCQDGRWEVESVQPLLTIH